MKRYFRLAAVSIVVLAPLGSASAQSDEPKALELGRQVFTELAQPQCGICHTLADAEAAGEVGPSLDELKPTEDKVRLAVSDGVGAMPAYGETLTPEQIDAVAHYVATVTGAEEE